jgi:hypothetical protein
VAVVVVAGTGAVGRATTPDVTAFCAAGLTVLALDEAEANGDVFDAAAGSVAFGRAFGALTSFKVSSLSPTFEPAFDVLETAGPSVGARPELAAYKPPPIEAPSPSTPIIVKATARSRPDEGPVCFAAP